LRRSSPRPDPFTRGGGRMKIVTLVALAPLFEDDNHDGLED
jgi:hypothetical protein